LNTVEIRVEDLEYFYNSGTPLEVRALSGVTFSLPGSKVLGILGGTGSGKTTLIKSLNGLLIPTRGRVLIDGTDTRSPGSELRRKVGVVFQRPERQLFEETVFLDVTFVLRRFSTLSQEQICYRAEQACKAVGLDLAGVGNRSPMALSDGEKRKAAIAGVLINEPEALVLDEPAVGLDPPSVAELVRALHEFKASGQTTIVIVSHDMENFLGLLDLLLVLHKGTVAAFGSPEEVCEQLAGDPALTRLLPRLALLIHDIRQVGHAVAERRFNLSGLARELVGLMRSEGSIP
jgi:energy-coupling factor transport system ATP-binding protein